MAIDERRGGAAIIPGLRYADAPGAIAWLCEAFGFEKHLVVEGENGTIAHAQLTYRNAMVMLGSGRDDADGCMTVRPVDAGGVTQALYVVVDDVDAHCARARAAGAEIVMEPEDQDYGGRLYSCRDPEKHLWHFGSYDPWKGDG